MVSDNSSNQDVLQQIKAFDETKAGVKGLVNAEITKLPPFCVLPQEERVRVSYDPGPCHIPVIDLAADTAVRRAEVVKEIRQAAESVGLFQVVNHGKPKTLLEETREAVRRFHELPREVKAEYYSS